MKRIVRYRDNYGVKEGVFDVMGGNVLAEYIDFLGGVMGLNVLQRNILGGCLSHMDGGGIVDVGMVKGMFNGYTVNNVLRVLVKRGLLLRVKNGVYVVSGVYFGSRILDCDTISFTVTFSSGL